MTEHTVQREIWEFLSKFGVKYCILTILTVSKGSKPFQIPLKLEQLHRPTHPCEIDKAGVLMTGHQFSFEMSDRGPDKKGRVRRSNNNYGNFLLNILGCSAHDLSALKQIYHYTLFTGDFLHHTIYLCMEC